MGDRFDGFASGGSGVNRGRARRSRIGFRKSRSSLTGCASEHEEAGIDIGIRRHDVVVMSGVGKVEKVVTGT